MATERTNPDILIRQQIKTLNEQYDMALKNGDEFSILRTIREQLKSLQQLLANGNSDGNDNSKDVQL